VSTLELRVVGDVLCLLLCVGAAIFDLRTRRIPNALTLPAVVVGIALALWGGWYDLAGAVMAVVLLGGVFALFAAAGGLGWGDVKLMAAVGALLGWPLQAWAMVLYALLYTAICGGLLAVVVAALQRRLGAALKATVALPRRDREKKNSGVTIPYGVAIGVGTLWAIGARYLPMIQLG
jgi:prepilin peptidase CpaA